MRRCPPPTTARSRADEGPGRPDEGETLVSLPSTGGRLQRRLGRAVPHGPGQGELRTQGLDGMAAHQQDGVPEDPPPTVTTAYANGMRQ